MWSGFATDLFGTVFPTRGAPRAGPCPALEAAPPLTCPQPGSRFARPVRPQIFSLRENILAGPDRLVAFPSACVAVALSRAGAAPLPLATTGGGDQTSPAIEL